MGHSASKRTAKRFSPIVVLFMVLASLAMAGVAEGRMAWGPDVNGKYYGAPFGEQVNPAPEKIFNSIGAAQGAWWNDFHSVNGAHPDCNYRVLPVDPTLFTNHVDSQNVQTGYGYVQLMPLTGSSCGGWGQIGATAYPTGYFAQWSKTSHSGKGCDCSTGRVSTGDPIDIATGNVYVKENDLISADPRLHYSRSYNSEIGRAHV